MGCKGEFVTRTCFHDDLKITHAADELKSNLSVAEGYITNIVKQHEKCKDEVIASTEVLIPKKLQELKQKLMEAFDVLEESIRLDGNEQRIKYTAKHDVEKEKWAKHNEYVNEATQLLSSVQKNGSPVHLYVVVNKLQDTLKDVVGAIVNQGSRLQSETVSLKECVDLQKVLSCKPCGLAELCVTKTTISLLE